MPSANGGGTTVRVAVRVRPALDKAGTPECITCSEDGRTLQISTLGEPGALSPLTSPRGSRARSLAFDSVHEGTTSQEELFRGCGMPELLEAALDGYTATVFAYGQTGSGKTYTVSGSAPAAGGRSGAASSPAPQVGEAPAANAGLMQRCAHYLYDGMSRRQGVRYTVRATYLEIYNEQVT